MRLVSFRRLPPKGAPYLMANTDYAEKSQSSEKSPEGLRSKGAPLAGFRFMALQDLNEVV